MYVLTLDNGTDNIQRGFVVAKWENIGERLSCLFAARAHPLFSLTLPAMPPALLPPAALSSSSSSSPHTSSLFPHFTLSPSLTLLSTSRFSFPEMRGVYPWQQGRGGGGGGRRRRRRRGEGAASFGNLMLHGWKVQRKYVTPTSRRPAECARQMDLQGNYQWLMRSALFNCTNAILSP